MRPIRGTNIAFTRKHTGSLNSWRYPVVYDVNGASGRCTGRIFYDQNNTGYYVDPNSVSYLYGLTRGRWFVLVRITGFSWTGTMAFIPPYTTVRIS
jgi:hypothetical protein